MSMSLKEYIEFVGEDAAAELFNTKITTIRSWRYKQRQPRVEEAKKIISKSGGKLNWESIYGPVEQTAF